MIGFVHSSPHYGLTGVVSFLSPIRVDRNRFSSYVNEMKDETDTDTTRTNLGIYFTFAYKDICFTLFIYIAADMNDRVAREMFSLLPVIFECKMKKPLRISWTFTKLVSIFKFQYNEYG